MRGTRGSNRQNVSVSDEPNRFGEAFLIKAFELIVPTGRCQPVMSGAAATPALEGRRGA